MRELSDYIPTGVNPGGKTPSFQAKLGSDLSQRYQIKRSNFIKIFRKMIGLDSDQSDILGEYIASKVIAELLNEKSQDPSVKSPPDLAPEVNLVYDKEFDDFCIASKYLNYGDKLGKNQLVEKINKSLNEKSQVPKSLSEKLQVSNNRTKQWSSQITPNTNRIAPNNISHSISFSDKSKQSNNKKGRL